MPGCGLTTASPTASRYSAGLWKGQREGVDGITIPGALKAIVDASFAKVSWDDWSAHLATATFTLTQGDFHPYNAMLMPGGKQVVLFDWEMVGAGSPGQELGQFMMNVNPEFRRAHEKELVRGYIAELASGSLCLHTCVRVCECA